MKQANSALTTFPTSEIERELAELEKAAKECTQEVEKELIDLSDTITHWQVHRLKRASNAR